MNFLKNIDEYFSYRPKKDFIYLLLAIVLMIGFIIYYFIYPRLVDNQDKLKKEYKDILEKYNANLASINMLKAKISLINKNINQQKYLLNNLNKKIIYYVQLTNLLDFAEFDQYKWAQIIKNSVIDAKKEGLEVKKVTNVIYDINLSKNFSNIKKRMDISLVLKGNLKSFIYYIYNYENKKELIRVSEMNVTLSNYSIKFSIYGFNQ